MKGKKKIYKLKCNICGVEFESTDSRRRYCLEHRDKNTQQYYRNQKNKQKIHSNVSKVKTKPGTKLCTGKVAKKCIYGGTCGGTYCCNYLLITGHMRGCNWRACDKYKAGQKLRPKVDKGGRVVYK